MPSARGMGSKRQTRPGLQMQHIFLGFLILLALIGAGCAQSTPNQLTPTGPSPTVQSEEDVQPLTGPTVLSQEDIQPLTDSVAPVQQPTPCPLATPEPFRVEPVISPTDQLSQVINVVIGNGESVTITTQAGTFTGTDDAPFSVNVTLLPNTTNYLKVVAFLRLRLRWLLS